MNELSEWEVGELSGNGRQHPGDSVGKSMPPDLDPFCNVSTDEDFLRAWISELQTQNEGLRKDLDVAIQVDINYANTFWCFCRSSPLLFLSGLSRSRRCFRKVRSIVTP